MLLPVGRVNVCVLDGVSGADHYAVSEIDSVHDSCPGCHTFLRKRQGLRVLLLLRKCAGFSAIIRWRSCAPHRSRSGCRPSRHSRCNQSLFPGWSRPTHRVCPHTFGLPCRWRQIRCRSGLLPESDSRCPVCRSHRSHRAAGRR